MKIASDRFSTRPTMPADQITLGPTTFQSRIYNATIAALKRLDFVLNEIIPTDHKSMSALQTKLTVVVT